MQTKYGNVYNYIFIMAMTKVEILKYTAIIVWFFWGQFTASIAFNESSRALHEKEKRPKAGLTYYVFPGYLFPMLTSLSWLCWLFPNSILPQQLGSGLHGLGIDAVGLDWSSISSYLGSPLASPWFATANIAIGFVLFIYVITSITYWFNIYKSKTFPIFSDGIFTSTGQDYNITAIIDTNFHINFEAYEQEGPLSQHLVCYDLCSQFCLLHCHCCSCLSLPWKGIENCGSSAFEEKKMDVHTKLIRKYKQVPEWWFSCILLMNITATVFICEYYKDQLQLSWWGVLLERGLAFFFTIPIGVITATTNQSHTVRMGVQVLDRCRMRIASIKHLGSLWALKRSC